MINLITLTGLLYQSIGNISNITNLYIKEGTTMLSILGLILSLILIMYLAYKGYSTIITAPIIAILTIILTTGFNGHLMANYTEVYMVGFSNFIKN